MSGGSEVQGGIASAVVEGPERARAKINLFLHVGRRREDGFHPLQSLAVFTELGDALTAAPADALSLSLDGPFAAALGVGEDNLVLRAARALNPSRGAALTLTKTLPVASGIGGGSADAAAALRALVALWEIESGAASLLSVAAGLGSDVPACLISQARWMEGRGEILSPPAALPRLSILLANPGVAVATKDVFSALAAHSGADAPLPAGRFSDLADILCFLESTRNDLEAPAMALQPVVATVLAVLRALPGALFARMSGSGATCFALFQDDESCAHAAAILKSRRLGWWIAPTFVPAFDAVREGEEIEGTRTAPARADLQ